MEQGVKTNYVYVGSYADAQKSGIHVFSYDPKTRAFTLVESVSGIVNPTFIALHPDGTRLYAVREALAGAGGVTAYAITRETGRLRPLNTASVADAAPCFVSVHPTGRFLQTANYTGSSLHVFPLAVDGQIGAATAAVRHEGHGPRLDRQDTAHPHSAILDPSQMYLLLPDLGLDQIVIYRLDAANGTLHRHGAQKSAPGAGPRLFAFHPKQAFGYVINELDNTIVVYAYDAAHGALTPVQTVSTLPTDFVGENTAAHLLIANSGRYLYASNRGHDSLAVYAIDPDNGHLDLVQHVATGGRTPRYFTITPDGRTLLAANQDSASITIFAIDEPTGKLARVSQVDGIPSPACIACLAIS